MTLDELIEQLQELRKKSRLSGEAEIYCGMAEAINCEALDAAVVQGSDEAECDYETNEGVPLEDGTIVLCYNPE